MAAVDVDHGEKVLLQRHMKRFVSMVKEYPVLNLKSNTPDARQKRTEAIVALKSRVKEELHLELSEAQVWKKLQNMKTRMRKKYAMKRMGRMVEMKEWEVEFSNFMESDANIKILDVKGAVAEEVLFQPIKTEVFISECDTLSFSEEDSANMNIEDHKPAFECCEIKHETPFEPEALMNGDNSQERKRRLQETEETRDLSTPELKRLVLLEQLKYYRKKQRLADIQIRRELQRERDEAAPSQWSNDD